MRAAERAHVDGLGLLHLRRVGPVAEGEEGSEVEHEAKERKGKHNPRVDTLPYASGAAYGKAPRGLRRGSPCVDGGPRAGEGPLSSCGEAVLPAQSRAFSHSGAAVSKEATAASQAPPTSRQPAVMRASAPALTARPVKRRRSQRGGILLQCTGVGSGEVCLYLGESRGHVAARGVQSRLREGDVPRFEEEVCGEVGEEHQGHKGAHQLGEGLVPRIRKRKELSEHGEDVRDRVDPLCTRPSLFGTATARRVAGDEAPSRRSRPAVRRCWPRLLRRTARA